MSKINSEDVRNVARLARLELNEEQITKFTVQLEKILEYVDQLEGVDTKDIPPTTRAVEVVNVMRDDKINTTKVREELLNLAPEREDDFFRVPKIL